MRSVPTTSFFSDIVGFTTISEKTDPHVLIACLAEYFNAMTDIIQAREGVVGDFIGDAVFAFWNTPARSSRHAYLACDAAMAQQEALVALRAQWEKRNLPQLRIRIGINSGKALAGNVGSDTRMKVSILWRTYASLSFSIRAQYTLIGDSVNLAARLEGLGKQYSVGITISQSTYDEPGVREAFVSRVLDLVAVVGKSEPTLIMTLIARREHATPAQVQLEALSWSMIEAYRMGRMVEAVALLEQMRVLAPDCESVVAMLGRARALCETGVPPDWNGVSKMTSK